MAFGITSTLPVASAGFTKTEDEEKSAYTEQPRLHCAQKKHDPLSLLFSSGLVKIESLDGITGIPSLDPASLKNRSSKRGFGGGRKIPSGSLGMFSTEPKTPMSLSTLSYHGATSS